MKPFSTILFISGEPVGYEVTPTVDGFTLYPAVNAERLQPAPLLHLYMLDNGWQVKGTEDVALIAQVLEEVRTTFTLPQQDLSAAP